MKYTSIFTQDPQRTCTSILYAELINMKPLEFVNAEYVHTTDSEFREFFVIPFVLN